MNSFHDFAHFAGLPGWPAFGGHDTPDFACNWQANPGVPFSEAYCAGAAHLRAKVWVGKGGTVTPVHRDVPHNLHVHLTGQKRWLLFSPRDSARMYPRGFLSGMPNFGHVDPERPDYERYPRFRGVTPLGGVVNPGEAVFIPHGWWHHTRTLDDAVSMNFWWGGRLINLASLASTMFKRVRGIRQDEWAA